MEKDEHKASDTYFDLTKSQSLIWMGQKLSPASPMYNMALAFRIPLAIDVPRFKAAFQKMLQLCDAMRTVFVETAEQPQQKISPSFSYEMEVLDFSTLSERETYLENWLDKRSQFQFDMTSCLFDAVLIKLTDQQYVWYFNEHHLITDAWAVTVQFETLSLCYQRLLADESLDDITLPSFKAYIDYEARQRRINSNEEAVTFWKSKAAQLPVPPSFFGNSNLKLESRSERTHFVIDKERADALRALTQESDLRTWTQHLSLFSIFSTLLFTYLYRLTGQKKLAIGTPAHNRSTANFKKTPGIFIELFPLLTTIEPEDTFSALFQKVRNETHEFLRYAQTGVSSPEINRGFNVVLNYINASFAEFNDVTISSDWVHARHADPGHLMRLQVHDFDATGCISLGFDLNVSVFDKEQRGNVANQFLQLVDSFIQDRFQAIGNPSLVTVPFNFTATTTDFKYDNAATVLSLFQTNVVKLPPETQALKYGGKALTYQELDQHANRLSHYLIQNGLEKGDRVVILLPRAPEFIISVLAVMKAGATFIPVPANHPSGRTLAIIEDAQCKLILSNTVLAARLPQTFDQLICLDKEATFIKQQSDARPELLPFPDDTAYMIYTSGSTGTPKGVMVEHQSLTHYIQWASYQYTDGFRPVVPLFTAVGFDLTITAIFLPLIAGGTIVTYQEALDGPDLSLFQVMEDNLVNLIKLTPAHLGLLRGKSYPDSSIKTMIVGGENFKTDLAVFAQNEIGKDIKIYNEYGPTEATVGCVVHCFEEQKDSETVSVPIGNPIANTRCYILDDFHNIVPAGVAGELYISGAGLAKGYWSQEELTLEKFITDPFNAENRLYRSGDLVRYNVAKGVLEYLGRTDDQVKIRGRRVELAEIESLLNQYDGIDQSVVALRQRKQPQKSEAVHNCTKCGLPSNYPTASFNEEGVCNLCQSFTSYQEKVQKYFKTPADLKALFDSVPQEAKGSYDCIMLLSGGKDSSYALAQLKEMGLNVLAFTLDNGYISKEALANVSRVAEDLGVDCVIGKTAAMNAIFVDSLQRHCNVCDGCFKTIYTLSVQLALEKKIPFIVTGLSRGQFFETRLTEELFRKEEVDIEKIDETILKARKAYHQVDDAVKELLDVSMFEDETTFEKVRFVDFYRYTDVSLAEMLDYLNNKLPWVRPSDTGRSTNCLINQAGIYVHKKEQGYSNYAFPYSWDVRIGHKTRDASLEEINEEIDEKEVFKILKEIGYQEAQEKNPRKEQLVAYYKSDVDIDELQLRHYLLARLPDYMVPVQFIPLETVPLTTNGKVDRLALPKPDAFRPVLETPYVDVENEFQEIIREVWAKVMQLDRIGIYDNFIAIGGDSLSGIRVMSRLSEAFELELPVNLIFQHPTIAQLAIHIEATITSMLAALEEGE